MMKTRHPNVTVNPDRHGKLRARYRKAGEKAVYLKTLPDQPGFEDELKAIRGGVHESEERHAPGTINALMARYYKSADFAAKGTASTRKTRRGILEAFRDEFGKDLAGNFTFEHIEAILIAKKVKRTNDKGREIGGEVAARNLRKQLRRFFAYIKKVGAIPSNPVEDAEKIGKARIKGYHTWTEDDIARYQAKHPFGTKARLALEIILWTGQRRGDARLFGARHIVNGNVNYTAAKTGAEMWLPVARDLRLAIDTMQSVGISAYVVTEYGKPFTKEGFGNKVRDWCNEAGLPQCTAHGLRKAIGRRMAQMRLTDEQMMAVGGWSSAAQVRTYTEAVDKVELAGDAMTQIDSRYSVTKGSQDV